MSVSIAWIGLKLGDVIDVTVRFKGGHIDGKTVTFYDPKEAEAHTNRMINSFGPNGDDSMDWLEVNDRKNDCGIVFAD